MNTSISFFSKVFILIAMPFLVKAQSVKLLPDYPSTIKAGEQFIMAVRITKGEASNAARLQVELPSGFDAKVVNPLGSDFSFQNNVVKFFWTSLPDANEFTVSFNIIPSATLIGKQTITGEFIYGEVDKSQHVPLRPCVVNITPADQSNADGKSKTPKVERKIISGNPQKTEYKVELTFTPNGITEAAQFTDIIPPDYSAFIIDAHEASYSLENQSVIFSWKKLPSEKTFVVSYLVRSSTAGATPVFNGTLSYGDALEISTPASASINPVTPETEQPSEPPAVTTQDQTDASSSESLNSHSPTETPATNTQPQPSSEETKSVQQQTSSSGTNQATSNGGQIGKIPTDEKTKITGQTYAMTSSDKKQVDSKVTSGSAIVFYVQISATHESPARDSKWLKDNLKINEPVEIMSQEGWNKYVIGHFNSIGQAVKVQTSTREKISDAFVVAYQNGVRIPVKEAIRNKALNQ
jgi:hypothetical protein